MPPGRARGRGRPRSPVTARGRGLGSNALQPEVHVEEISRAAQEQMPDSIGATTPVTQMSYLDTMLAGVKPHGGGTLKVKPWSGGQEFLTFRMTYKQQAIGAGWPQSEQVLRLVGFLDGLPAIRYMSWLENGKLVGVSLETALKMLQKEFFDEEEEALTACEKWRNRKQKLDETVDEYHAVFVSNADRAGIILDKELLRQWGRNVLPPLRAAVQTARFSNPALTFQSGVKIARDVHTALCEEEPATAFKRGVREDMDEDLVDARRVRAIASTAAEGVIKNMEAEVAHIRRELLKAQDQVRAMEAKEEMRDAIPERPEWRPRGRGRGGYSRRVGSREVLCTKCGYPGHHREQCRFEGECFLCGETGHKKEYCRKRKQGGGRTAQPEVVEAPHPKGE